MAATGRSVGARDLVCGLIAAALSASTIGGCSQKGDSDQRAAVEPTCVGAQAIGTVDLHGTSLPMKTLSLTFDDGPGARTAELSTYLKAQGIASSFFVNGKMLAEGTAVLQQIAAEGHLVGNHTQTHTSLTGRSTGSKPLSAEQIVDELSQTDALIAPFAGGRFVFRAPYGDFDAPTATVIDASPMKKYVGPINWEIGDHMGPAQAADWDCWTPGADGVVLTPEQCGELYVKEIDSVGRGVVLLHDPYFVDDDPSKGGTVDMVKQIVPILKAKGYAFVRVDRVPEIAALLPAEVADAGLETTTTEPSGEPDSGTSESHVVDASPSPDPCAPSGRPSR